MPLVASELDAVLQQAARIAADYLKRNDDRETPVLHWRPPDEMARCFDFEPGAEGVSYEQLLADCERVLEESVRTGHPGFVNQLYGGWDLAGILGEWMTALLNTSMYTYEVAPVLTLMETALIQRLGNLAGFSSCEGVFAPGGSISNLMAVLAARDRAVPGVKAKGIPAHERLALFMSKEAHYSTKRAASILGHGLEAVRPVATDRVGRMLPDALEAAVEKAYSDGARPFFVVATSGTTVAGAFDPLEPIAAIAGRHGMWLHVDASYGGGVLFSARHRHLMRGCDRADSLSINPHKMLGVPLACSALLVKEKGRLRSTNALAADYLFHDDPEVSCDLGDLTIQCGRRVDALKLWLSWRAHGDAGYERRIARMFELAGLFRRMIEEREHFVLAREPEGCNVCFHYLTPSVRALPAGEHRDAHLEVATATLRERVKRAGRVMINYAPLDNIHTFRIVINNPEASEADLSMVLDEIERAGADL